MKSTLGIYEAKASLSKLIKAIKTHGVSFQISERGKPVAILSPITEENTLEERLADLIKAGILEMPREAGHPQPIAHVKGSLKRFLEERE